jgi:hypothetical protein
LILLHLLIVTKVIWMLMMKILMILKTRKWLSSLFFCS